MKLRSIVFVLCGGILLSCGSKKRATQSSENSSENQEVVTPKESTPEVSKPPVSSKPLSTTEAYIATFKNVAMEEMRLYGIPASITLAQGILESGSGNGDLAKRSNNHFGIKCHRSWTGERVYHDDDELGECFRKYPDPKISYRDHSLFLFERKRYLPLFKLAKDDYKAWAKGLRAAGYATDKRYPEKLISLINRYQLYTFDAMVLGKDPRDARKVVTRKDRYTVKKGDTLYSIARRHKLKVDELKGLNGLQDDAIYEGQVLFVKPMPKDY